MNVPGIAKGNWGWRLKDGALTHEIAEELRSISIEFGRIGDFSNKPVSRPQKNDLRPQIARRAYELYERGGRQNGQTVQNWLLAEREIEVESKP
jgi:4-alpha-glucanotransferase